MYTIASIVGAVIGVSVKDAPVSFIAATIATYVLLVTSLWWVVDRRFPLQQLQTPDSA
jgi:hypothetical protein